MRILLILCLILCVGLRSEAASGEGLASVNPGGSASRPPGDAPDVPRADTQGDWALAIDYAELRFSEGETAYFSELAGEVTRGRNAFVAKLSLVNLLLDNSHEVEAQLRYGRNVRPGTQIFTGLRSDFLHGSTRHFAIAGANYAPVDGVELEAAGFLSDEGHVFGRLEAAADIPIGKKWTLQPKAELSLSAQKLAAEELGAGLAEAQVATRLIFALTPRFQPYVGAAYRLSIGETAEFARATGANVGAMTFMLGFAFTIQ